MKENILCHRTQMVRCARGHCDQRQNPNSIRIRTVCMQNILINLAVSAMCANGGVVSNGVIIK